MKKILLSLACLLCTISAWAGHYKNFRATAYVMVQDVNRHTSYQDWEKEWATYSKNLKLDKVYLETYRDGTYVNDKAMKEAIKFFKKQGVEVSGGITYNYAGGGRQRWESFCYSNPEMLQIIQNVAEITAGYFDEIVLDDYYFTNCKCDRCIEARGDRSWGEFRRDLLDEVAKKHIVGPAHAKNPKCKVIVKYPNWYDHFHGLGFDLDRGPYTFDGVYTGTETRDPRGEQHLQCYESFGIIRYFENLRPGHNFGGWVDTGSLVSYDMFSEQLWFTLLAKAPEITLFNYSSMNNAYEGGGRWHRDMPRPWSKENPLLNIEAMKQESAKRGIENPTWGRIAEYSYEQVDKVLGALGTPKGVKAYKPFQSEGEDFLHNYMGMAGVPIEIVPQFPEDENVVILTECCKYDPEIIAKMKKFMQKGGDVIVTSGFYRAMQDKGIKHIFEMTATDRSADIDTVIVSGGYGRQDGYTPTAVPVRIPAFMYHTNDSWEEVTALSYGNGWPLLQHSVYSNGNIFVWVIPDNFSHLYALPAVALNRIRAVISRDMDVQLEGPSQVSLLTYDNQTFAVHNFHNETIEVKCIIRKTNGIQDLMSGETLKGEIRKSEKVVDRPIVDVEVVTVKLAPHSFRAFKIK